MEIFRISWPVEIIRVVNTQKIWVNRPDLALLLTRLGLIRLVFSNSWHRLLWFFLGWFCSDAYNFELKWTWRFYNCIKICSEKRLLFVVVSLSHFSKRLSFNNTWKGAFKGMVIWDDWISAFYLRFHRLRLYYFFNKLFKWFLFTIKYFCGFEDLILIIIHGVTWKEPLKFAILNSIIP